MKSQVVGLSLCLVLGGGTTGYSDDFQQVRDKNGVLGFTNTLSRTGASTEAQRAREQAEIEYWRALEARARSLRNTPDTEVHRKGKTALQADYRDRPKAPSGKKFHRRETEKMADTALPEQLEADKRRSRKMGFRVRRNATVSAAPGKKRNSPRGERVALK